MRHYISLLLKDLTNLWPAQILYRNMSSTTATAAATATTTATSVEPITAQNILRLFPDIDTSSKELDGHDEEQIRLMDEVCIVLDEDDKPIGNFSKKICACSSLKTCRHLG